MEEMGSISKDEMKLLLNFIKDNLTDLKEHVSSEDEQGNKILDRTLDHIQQYLED